MGKKKDKAVDTHDMEIPEGWMMFTDPDDGEPIIFDPKEVISILGYNNKGNSAGGIAALMGGASSGSSKNKVGIRFRGGAGVVVLGKFKRVATMIARAKRGDTTPVEDDNIIPMVRP